jgi:hypothetical protein
VLAAQQGGRLAFSTLKPMVGTVLSTSPMCSLYNMVVLPAASSPATRQVATAAGLSCVPIARAAQHICQQAHCTILTDLKAGLLCRKQLPALKAAASGALQTTHVPSITTRISLLPNKPSNSFLKVFPIAASMQNARKAEKEASRSRRHRWLHCTEASNPGCAGSYPRHP